ncbi:hypothetical protein KKD19_01505 [Patescibacteria group bacterium]|nr:hypothetical protein [Patescibacteria group bacterium]MBU4511908.1 hypothetical protein [Patescibacteria group bacterium]
MRTMLLFFLIIGILLLAGCAAGPNIAKNTGNEDGNVAGFWQGLWHGIIASITFWVSLFTDDVSIYEAHNNGGWYNFGFLWGMGILITPNIRVSNFFIRHFH